MLIHIGHTLATVMWFSFRTCEDEGCLWNLAHSKFPSVVGPCKEQWNILLITSKTPVPAQNKTQIEGTSSSWGHGISSWEMIASCRQQYGAPVKEEKIHSAHTASGYHGCSALCSKIRCQKLHTISLSAWTRSCGTNDLCPYSSHSAYRNAAEQQTGKMKNLS